MSPHARYLPPSLHLSDESTGQKHGSHVKQMTTSLRFCTAFYCVTDADAYSFAALQLSKNLIRVPSVAQARKPAPTSHSLRGAGSSRRSLIALRPAYGVFRYAWRAFVLRTGPAADRPVPPYGFVPRALLAPPRPAPRPPAVFFDLMMSSRLMSSSVVMAADS